MSVLSGVSAVERMQSAAAVCTARSSDHTTPVSMTAVGRPQTQSREETRDERDEEIRGWG